MLRLPYSWPYDAVRWIHLYYTACVHASESADKFAFLLVNMVQLWYLVETQLFNMNKNVCVCALLILCHFGVCYSDLWHNVGRMQYQNITQNQRKLYIWMDNIYNVNMTWATSILR